MSTNSLTKKRICLQFVLNISPNGTALRKYTSGGELLSRPVSKGKQDYQTNPSLYPLNKPIAKLEGEIQAAGEARYANDLPPQPREVFGAFVLSSVHGGEVDTIDVEDVLVSHIILQYFSLTFCVLLHRSHTVPTD